MIELVLAAAIAGLSGGVVLGRYLATGGRFLEPDRPSAPPEASAPSGPYREPGGDHDDPPVRMTRIGPMFETEWHDLPPRSPYGIASVEPPLDEAIDRAVTATPGTLRPKPAPLPSSAPPAVRNPTQATKAVRV